MGFFNTLITGYKLMFKDFSHKYGNAAPKVFSGCGTGLMMIGSAVMAKTGMEDDTKQLIAEADAAIAEAKKSIDGEKKIDQAKRVTKARAQKTWKVVKIFRKGIAMEVGGAVCNAIGIGISERGRTKALTACAAIGAQFAGYRAAVRDDLGVEADIRYLTGRKAVKKTEIVNKKTGEITEQLEYVNDDGVTIKKDPDAFKFWFSKETCPSLWEDNYDLRMANLKWVQDNINRQFVFAKHLSLNDMRREFGGLKPSKMDVGIGGIFGRVWDKNKTAAENHINLHYMDDKDFVEGRTDGCWIIFDCDPEPIIGKVNPEFTKVET